MARNRTLAAMAAVCLGLAAVAALAGGGIPIDPPEFSASVIFLDEFEDGGLTVSDVPPGKWDGLVDRPGIDAGVSAFAAHAGNGGLRIDDRADLPATGTTVSPYVALGPGDGDRYLRAWVRIPDTPDSGVVTLLQFLHGPRSVVDVTVAYPPGALLLAAETADGGYPVTATGYLMGSGWRLLEVALVDAGTDSATQTLWVDTARAGQHRVNQAGWTVDELDVGEPWADDGTFQGTIDFDGVAVTVDPPPSHVVVPLGGGFDGGMVAGQCQPFYAQLVSSSGLPAGSLRSDRLYLIADGGTASVATFTDPGCAVAGSYVDIDAGTTEVGFGLIGLAPGALIASIGTTDLLPGLLGLTVFPADGGTFDGGTDGGAPENDAGTTGGGDGGNDGLDGGDGGSHADAGEQGPPRQWEVCGCGAGSGPWSGAGTIALWALALARRRRRA